MNSSDPESGIDAATAILWKGCLGGAGLATLFLVISSATYLVLSNTGLDRQAVLGLSVASGPLVGSLVAIALYLRLASRR